MYFLPGIDFDVKDIFCFPFGEKITGHFFCHLLFLFGLQCTVEPMTSSTFFNYETKLCNFAKTRTLRDE